VQRHRELGPHGKLFSLLLNDGMLLLLVMLNLDEGLVVLGVLGVVPLLRLTLIILLLR
jgi:hypothetical protein